MKVLVINCGSSSLKYQLMNPETREVFAKGLCERIGIDGSRMEYEVPAKDYEVKIEKPMPTHKEALELVINAITDKEHGVIASVDEVEATMILSLNTALISLRRIFFASPPGAPSMQCFVLKIYGTLARLAAMRAVMLACV